MRRRMADRPGIGAEALETDLRARDESDAARMRPAPDAEVLDTSELEVEDVVRRIEELVHSGGTRGSPTSPLCDMQTRAPRGSSGEPSSPPPTRRRRGR